MPLVPDYAGPLTNPLKPYDDRLRRAALFFGATPLVLGTIDFLLWLPAQSQVFETAGFLIILGGLCLFALGSFMLLIHVITNWAYLLRGEDRGTRWSGIALTAVLLIGNFPACWFILFLVGTIRPLTFD